MREIFVLVGKIASEGYEKLNKNLNNLDKNAKQVSNKLNLVGKKVERAGINIAKMTAPLIAMGIASYKAVQMASDLAETVSKTGEMFGEARGDVEQWASTMATSFGQSKTESMEAAANFAIFGKAAGYTGKQLVTFSTRFTELASDLASFNNTSPDEAIVAIGAALRGENEPIRKFGVLLNDATMRQKALELGIVDTISKALTPQQKILAASNLIMEQTTAAQGDFARTSDQLANQQRILKAEIKDLATEYGKNFLPIALKIVKVLKENFLPRIKAMVQWFSELSPELKETIAKVTLFTVALAPALIALGKFLQIGKTLYVTIMSLKGAVLLLNSALLANPFVLAAAAIGAIAIAVERTTRAWKKWQETIAEDIAVKQVQALQKDLEELIPIYGELALMDKQPIGEKRFAELSARIKELETNVADAGYALEGSFGERAVKAENILTDLTETTEEATAATTDYADEISKLTSEITKKSDAAKKSGKAEKDEKIEALKLEMELNHERLKSFEELAKVQKAYFKQLEERAKTSAMNQIEYLLYQAEKEKTIAEKTLNDKEEIVEAKLNIDRYYNERRNEIEKQLYDQIIQYEKDVAAERERNIQKNIELSISAVDQLFNLWEMDTNNKLMFIDQQLQKNIEAINQSLMNETEKQKAIEALNLQADKKRKALMLKQAKRDKAAAIFKAIIDTASAVAEALPNIPLAIIMGLLGAAQIALIAAQPLPKLAKGATIRSKEGGTHAILGEGAEDEAVLPMKTGIKELVNGIISGLSGAVLPSGIPQKVAGAASAASATPFGNTIINWHIGTLIADDKGLKELDKRLDRFRIAERQRKGIEYSVV